MNSNFGKTLKTCRDSLRLTQTELAEKVDVTPEMVSQWENDHAKPSEDNMDILVDIFGDRLGVEYLKSKSKIAARCLSGMSYKPRTPREVPFLQSITANKSKEAADMLSEILLNERIDDDEIEMAHKCIRFLEENISQELENLTYVKDMVTKKIKNDDWLNTTAERKKFELFK